MVAYKSLKTKEKCSWVIPKVVAVAYGSFLAELRRPEGPPCGAPYSECRGKIKETHQAQVVQRLDNAIHRINHYPVDKC